MKQFFTTLFLLTNLSFVSFSQDLDWVRSFGSPDNDFPTAVASDPQGNTYVTGNYRETIQFPAGSGIDPLVYGGVLNSFIAKYDASGKLLWAKKLGESSKTYALVSSTAIAFANGSVYVAGNFQDEIDFDLGPSTATLSSYTTGSVFLAKYDADGNYTWAKGFGGGNSPEVNSSPTAYGIAIDESEAIYLAGTFVETADFDPGSGTVELTHAGGGDAFVTRFDAAGNLNWAAGFGQTGSDEGKTICVKNGSVYVGGTFTGTMDADPGSAVAAYTSNGKTDIFLSKFDAAGNYSWTNVFGDMEYDFVNGLVLDDAGNIFLTGSFNGTIDVDPTPAENNLTSNGGADILLAKYTPDGGLLWAQSYGSSGQDSGDGIACSTDGGIVITGNFNGSFDIDKSEATRVLTSNGSRDIFISKFDTDGNLVWAGGIGGTSVDGGEDILYTTSGEIILVGDFAERTQFDPASLSSKVTSNGVSDVYVAKFTDPTLAPVTGVPDALPDHTLKVYPNPTAGFINIATDHRYSKTSVTLTDIYGRVYYPETRFAENVLQADLRTYTKGIYFIAVSTPKYKTVKKVVLR